MKKGENTHSFVWDSNFDEVDEISPTPQPNVRMLEPAGYRKFQAESMKYVLVVEGRL